MRRDCEPRESSVTGRVLRRCSVVRPVVLLMMLEAAPLWVACSLATARTAHQPASNRSDLDPKVEAKRENRVAADEKAEKVAGKADADAEKAKPDASKPAPLRADEGVRFAPWEDPVYPFVPLRPRTVEERKRIEAIKAYVRARVLEDERKLEAAIDLLKKALDDDPQSIASLKRLSRICFALNRGDDAERFGARVLDVDPGDLFTLRQMIARYSRSARSEAAIDLLKKAEANPKLDKRSAAYLVIERDLGLLYSIRPDKIQETADAWAKVVEALDDKAANRFSVVEQRLILGNEESNTYLEFGVAFARAGRFDQAIKAFRRGLTYDPDNFTIPVKLAEAYLDAGRKTEALEVIEQWVRLRPQGRDGYALLARIYRALAREKEIIPRLEAASKADPQNVSLLLTLSDEYRAAGRIDKSTKALEAIMQLAPAPQTYGILGAAYLKEKKWEDLIKLLGGALKNQVGINAIEPQIKEIIDDRPTAESFIDAGIKMFTNDPASIDMYSRNLLAYIATQAKLAEKLVELDKLAIKINPIPPNYRELAMAQQRAGRYEDAVKTLEELTLRFPQERNAMHLILVASIEFDAGQFDRAAEAARRAVKMEPNNSEIVYRGAFILARVGRVDEAVVLLTNAEKLDPDNIALFRMHGLLLAQAGRDDEAIRFFKDILDRKEDDESFVKAARLGLSIAYTNKSDYSAGEKELEILLEKFPDDPEVNNDLGYLYADQGKNLEKAEAMIRKALDEEKDNSAYLDSLGWVLFKRGKAKEAVEPLSRAAQDREGTDTTVHEHLGDVYFELQEYDKARESWETAEKKGVKAHPPDKHLPEIRKKLESLKKFKQAPKTATSGSI